MTEDEARVLAYIAIIKDENAKLRAALKLTLPLFGDGQFPVTADIVERTLRECSCDDTEGKKP